MRAVRPPGSVTVSLTDGENHRLVAVVWSGALPYIFYACGSAMENGSCAPELEDENLLLVQLLASRLRFLRFL